MTTRGWSGRENPWPGVKCANPDCGHSATAHNDLDYCERSSPTKGDCTCESFELPEGAREVDGTVVTYDHPDWLDAGSVVRVVERSGSRKIIDQHLAIVTHQTKTLIYADDGFHYHRTQYGFNSPPHYVLVGKVLSHIELEPLEGTT